jgi:ribokinase
LLKLCDIVVVNEIELGALSGRALSDTAEAADLLAALRAVRASESQIVIAARGRSGFVCLGPDGVLEAAGHLVPVIDSTGAGDCFVGSLAAGLAADRNLARALALANAAAALSVTRAGAGSSMPTRAEVAEQFGL